MLIRFNTRGKNFSSWFIPILVLLYTIPSFAQKNLPDINLTLDVKGVPFSKLLEIISEKSNVTFSYNPKKVEATQMVSYSVQNRTLTQVLDDLSALYGFNYQLVENQVILKPEKKTQKKTSQLVTLSGNINAESSGEALIGTSLYITELQTGTV